MKLRRFLAFFIDLNIVAILCQKFYTSFNIYIITGIIIFGFKDIIFRNASIGKKIMRLEIKTLDNKKPSFSKLITRNLTNIVWPIEVLFIIFKDIRISDLILKLKVEEKALE